MQNESTRRDFLKFFGRTIAASALVPGLPTLLSSCSTVPKNAAVGLPFAALPPGSGDRVQLAQGFDWKLLAKWGDPLNSRGETFGTNNDYLAFIPLDGKPDDGLLWVNHEAVFPLLVSGYHDGIPRTKEQVSLEQQQVGGTIMRVVKEVGSNEWKVKKDDPMNRRLTARTPIRFVGDRRIEGAKSAIGTLGNCAGGVTPWGTVLTCEENYSDFYGERSIASDGSRRISPSKYRWEEFFPYPPEHYGWVVEVHPRKGLAQKLVALGRFAHEGATIRKANDGRCVVYMGDDAPNRCLFKFIAAKAGSLEHGKLYVANLEKGQWVSLNIDEQPRLKSVFKDQTEVMIRCREAAFIVGGTGLARPEDIEIDPETGAVYVVLTNNEGKADYYGSILKIDEKDADPLALSFAHSVFMTGGPESGFACPDNLAFDPKGGLWLTTDISGKVIGKNPYEPFQNNSLFYIPMKGANAGRALRVAIAPTDAEFTGPCFSPDGRTLFLSVQHPGEESKSLTQLTSHWPDGGTSVPRSGVIAISGEALDRLTAV